MLGILILMVCFALGLSLYLKTDKTVVRPAHLNLENEAKEASFKLHNLLHEESYLGCLYWPQLDLYDDASDSVLKTGISITDRNDKGLSSFIKRNASQDSSMFKVQTISAQRIPLTRAAEVNEVGIYVKNTNSMRRGKRVIIADCLHAEINQITMVDKKQNRLGLMYPLHYRYENYPQIGELIEHVLFVHNGKHVKKGLFYRKVHQEEPLAPSVVQMLAKSSKTKENVVDVMFVLEDELTREKQAFNTSLNLG